MFTKACFTNSDNFILCPKELSLLYLVFAQNQLPRLCTCIFLVIMSRMSLSVCAASADLQLAGLIPSIHLEWGIRVSSAVWRKRNAIATNSEAAAIKLWCFVCVYVMCMYVCNYHPSFWCSRLCWLIMRASSSVSFSLAGAHCLLLLLLSHSAFWLNGCTRCH